MQNEGKKKLLTTKEAEKLLGVCRHTISNYHKSFDLPRNKIGGRWFYEENELLDWALKYNFVKINRDQK